MAAHRHVLRATPQEGLANEAPVERGATLVQAQGPQAATVLAPSLAGREDRAGTAGPRWSADGWVLWRDGSGSGQVGSGRGGKGLGSFGPSYGASQAGAVLRYRLMPGDAHRLAAYGRFYAALGDTGEREAAAGLSARPLPRVPVAAMVELRASRFTDGQTHLRPAVMAVSEVPPITLPLALRAEAYAQGGYVGGAGATGFVDGQLRVDRPVDVQGRASVALGGGAWGGAQTGAQRLDMGPSARFSYSDGHMSAHLAIDWRFRVAGNAQPLSGPAITLSAGF